jgi:two-component system, NtrC family, sensor histidine kinase HydH
MYFHKTYNRAFFYAIVFTVVVSLTAIIIYSSLSKWQNTMVQKNKLICELYVNKLYESAINDINTPGMVGLLENKDLSSSEIKRIDTILKKLSGEVLKMRDGLEGGFYLHSPDEFYGYSFPTSPPPIPVYGPPPRSYNIIKNQALQSISENRLIVELHAFDAAIFPLATKPLVLKSKIAGIVWVRIHIQDDLPIIKLKQVVNIAAIVSILGFIVLMLVSSLWGGEIQGIKNEMENIRNDPAFRLRKRWGIFGYISSNVNQMLETIEKENFQRHLLEQQLNQKEKLASLGNMIAGVAHEVKTPLAIIKTRIQMWQQVTEKNADISKHISPESMQIVINETNRLTNLVKKLLIFSRPIDKKMKQTNINKLIEEVVEFINIERNNKSVTIDCDLNPDLPLILIDENSIKQVFINLVENSIEAMPDGGAINFISHKDATNEKIEIEISDTGKGIPEEIFNKVFEPFFTSKESGVGLGLAISYQIIKAHNGEISFLNNSGKGTKCIIKLPLSQ